MENWFERNAAKSIVIHTLIVAGAVWAAFEFVFDKNKVAAYQGEVANVRATAEQYKAKTEVLEVEIARLRDENKKYLDWMVQTPNTIPHLEGRIKVLLDENAKQKAQLTGIGSPSKPAFPTLPYSNGKSLYLGEAFVDPQTNAIVGVAGVNSDFTTDIRLTLPGQKAADLVRVKPGTSWTFEQGTRRYMVTVPKIDWYTNKAEVQIREIDARAPGYKGEAIK